MKRLAFTYSFVLSLSLTLLIGAPFMGLITGCAQTPPPGSTTQPIDPIAVAADQVTVMVTALNIVRSTPDASGKPLIGDEDWNGLVLPSVHALQNALLAWQAAPPGTPDAVKAEGAFLAALPNVLQLVENAQSKAHPVVPKKVPVN